MPPNTMQLVRTTDGEWVKPSSMEELIGVLSGLGPSNTYRLVAGNTGTG